MFERYTEKARRVIFFGRYEASQVGSKLIEPEHLLLGLLRERKNLLGIADTDAVKKEIESKMPVAGKPISTSVDLPLSSESKRVLTYAAEEAEDLSHKPIGTDHIVLGLLRDSSPAKEVLENHGLGLAQLRAEMQLMKTLDGQPANGKFTTQIVESQFTQDLAAINTRIAHLQTEMREMNAKLDKILERLGD